MRNEIKNYLKVKLKLSLSKKVNVRGNYLGFYILIPNVNSELAIKAKRKMNNESETETICEKNCKHFLITRTFGVPNG